MSAESEERTRLAREQSAAQQDAYRNLMRRAPKSLRTHTQGGDGRPEVMDTAGVRGARSVIVETKGGKKVSVVGKGIVIINRDGETQVIPGLSRFHTVGIGVLAAVREDLKEQAQTATIADLRRKKDLLKKRK